MEDTYKAAKEVADVLLNNGFETYFVGVCVRDQVLKKTPKEWTVLTNASLSQLEQLGYKSNLNVLSFNQSLEDYLHWEFTINALLQDPISGVIIDRVNGLKDIERRLIRLSSNSDKIMQERPIKIMEAFRLVGETGFSIDKSLYKPIQHGDLHSVSVSLIKNEFIKIITSDNVSDALMYLTRFLSKKVPTCLSDLIKDCTDTIRAFDIVGPIPDYKLALCFIMHVRGISYRASSVTATFGISGEDYNSILNIIYLEDRLIEKYSSVLTLADKRKLAADKDIDAALELCKLLCKVSSYPARNVIKASNAVALGKSLGLPPRLVSHDDLISWGFVLEGNAAKNILESAYAFQLDQPDPVSKELILSYLITKPYKNTLRLLPNGNYTDGTKRVKVACRCSNCNSVMVFTTGLAQDRPTSQKYIMKNRVLETINCKNDSYEYMACTVCYKRKMKSKFDLLKED